MKKVISLLLLIGTLGFATAAFAQVAGSTQARLFIKSTENRGDFVEIVYEINFPGFVELHLSDSKGEKLWIKGTVTDHKGFGKVRVPTKPLEPGKYYPFILKYKGKDYKGTIFM